MDLRIIITEMEYELDRITLYNDVPSKASIMVMLGTWIKNLENHICEPGLEFHHYKDCDNSNTEMQSMREAVAELESKIRQIKEIC